MLPSIHRIPLILALLIAMPGAVHAESPVERRAREALDQALLEVAPPSPAHVEIILEGLGIEGHTLEDADFILDGTPLAAGSPEQLHAKGEHRIYTAAVEPGPHTLMVTLVFRNTDTSIFSQLAGYRWKLASSVRFEAQRGLKVKVMVRPAHIPDAPNVPQRFTLSHGLVAELLAPIPETPQGGRVVAASARSGEEAAAETVPAVIRRSEGTLTVSALAGPRAVAGTVRLYGPENLEVSLTRGAQGGSQVALVPGRYVAEIVAPGYLSQMRTIQVAEGQQVELDFRLARTPDRKRVRVREGSLELVPPLRFVSGSSNLSGAAHQTLRHVVDAMVLHDLQRIQVEGHADGHEGRRTKGGDFAISLERANAVRDALVAAGLPPERVEVKSMGASKPRAPNVTPRGRLYNRRVELLIPEG
ncbi:MAG TPA: OmpA family protein [Myxococcaceae bacterium]|nr:OmpA family protein [Myxococcaceae bacterium]